MSLQAYQKTQRSTENAKQTEYRLFAQVTGALMDAERAGRSNLPLLVDALDWNRRLWSTLATDCSSDGNQLPQAVRARIISISIWVSKYSSEVAQKGASIEPLIDVNKSIMAGLSQRPAA